jgi:hypothetical protein
MAGLAEVNAWWGLGNIERSVDETALHGDGVFTEGIVLMQQSLNLLTESLDTLVLCLQLADVSFLALAESTL